MTRAVLSASAAAECPGRMGKSVLVLMFVCPTSRASHPSAQQTELLLHSTAVHLDGLPFYPKYGLNAGVLLSRLDRLRRSNFTAVREQTIRDWGPDGRGLLYLGDQVPRLRRLRYPLAFSRSHAELADPGVVILHSGEAARWVRLRAAGALFDALGSGWQCCVSASVTHAARSTTPHSQQ